MAALASDWLRHFGLLLWNRWTEFNETWQEARSQHPLPSLWFSGWSEKQDGRPCLWLAETFSTSPLKPLNGIQWNLTGSKISTPSTKFVFFGLIGKTRCPPGLWLAETFSTSSLKPLNGIQQNLLSEEARSQRPLPSLCFLGRSEKTRWPPWPLISWYIFDFSYETAERNLNETWQEARSQRPLPSLCFSSRLEKQDGRPGLWLAKIFDFSKETAERNSKKLDRKQDLNIVYQVCVFGLIGKTRWLP